MASRVRPSQAPKTQFNTRVAEAEQAKKDTFSGCVTTVKDTFAFAECDETGEDLLILPSQCRDWKGQLPRVGTRILFGVEPSNARGHGRRATDVRHEPGRHRNDAWSHENEKQSEQKDQWNSYDWPSDRIFKGTMDLDKGDYGFIELDGENGPKQRMFVLPWSCPNSVLPPVGSRVEFSIVTDSKSGKPRAEDVIPEGTRNKYRSNSWSPQAGELCYGTFVKDAGKFGFIRHDDSSEEVFLHPSKCVGFDGKLPALGTRVKFKVEADADTRGPSKLACDVYPEDAETKHEWLKGVVTKNCGNFGFINEGEDKIFVLPSCCRGREIFEVGTHVSYRKAVGKDGKVRAEDVDEDFGHWNEQFEAEKAENTENRLRGVLTTAKDSFGFIRVEGDGKVPDVFLHISQCPDRELPPEGTKLEFDTCKDRDDRAKLVATNVSILSTPREPPEPREAPREAQEPMATREDRAALIPRRARSYKSPEVAILWKRYCDEHAQGQYDFQEHSAFFLRQFLQDVLPEDVADAPPSKRQRT